MTSTNSFCYTPIAEDNREKMLDILTEFQSILEVHENMYLAYGVGHVSKAFLDNYSFQSDEETEMVYVGYGTCEPQDSTEDQKPTIVYGNEDGFFDEYLGNPQDYEHGFEDTDFPVQSPPLPPIVEEDERDFQDPDPYPFDHDEDEPDEEPFYDSCDGFDYYD
jgi:hypothetical protein